MSNLIQDNNGNISSMRIASLGIVFIFMLTWAITSLKAGSLAPMDAESVALLVGALGAKTWQKQVESQK